MRDLSGVTTIIVRICGESRGVDCIDHKLTIDCFVGDVEDNETLTTV